MKLFGKTVLAFVFAALALDANGEFIGIDTLHYEILLNRSILKELDVKDTFTSSVDITANRLILISSDNQFYLVGWGGMLPFGKPVEGNINSFAFTHDSVLMVIQTDELCYVASENRLSMLYRLQDEVMNIRIGDSVI